MTMMIKEGLMFTEDFQHACHCALHFEWFILSQKQFYYCLHITDEVTDKSTLLLSGSGDQQKQCLSSAELDSWPCERGPRQWLLP